jgi:hypothetical protein
MNLKTLISLTVRSAALPASLWVLMAACTHELPAYSARASQITGMEPQISARTSPERTASSAVLPATVKPPESSLDLTLTGDLSPLQPIARQALPQIVTEAGHPFHKDYRWTFTQMGEPKLMLDNDRVLIRTVYKGDLATKTASAVGCRLDPIYPIVEWSAGLGIRQDKADFILVPVDPQLQVGLRDDSDARCNMFSAPLRQQLAELFNREVLNEHITNEVQQAGMKIRLQPVWQKLHGPYAVPIASLNTKMCMYPSPSMIIVARLQGIPEQAILQGNATVHAMAALEQRCETPPIEAQHLSLGPLEPISMFRMLAIVPMPYQAVSQQLSDSLFHDEMIVKKGWFRDKKIRVDNVAASDAGGKLLIRVDTSGYINGPLYYFGTPRFDIGRTVVFVPDLQMDLETRSMLDDINLGVWQRVDDLLKDKLQRAMRVDLTDRIGLLTQAAAGEHKLDGLSVAVNIDRVEPEAVYSSPEGLTADVMLEGAARAKGLLEVDGLTTSVPTTSVPTR